ncbi:putative 26S proteasome regulatory subunit N9 [Paramicrosporidium saccamoebae]|uniref:Putative 26S proteasome regulatory subunit N9 n=1 Tax=Paramicrosporidium saccamoebae TaxID=1246581 RepID=A0A2H9TNP2_9FUNG|nr:putative 26S proteasome regulatory subunit N9 [Paramicrosporidium saccamoebae]
MSDAAAVLQRLASSAPAPLQKYFEEFHTLYEQKLWHQLTLRVQAFFAEPTAKPLLPAVFTQFVGGWHKKMNSLVFVKLSVDASRQMPDAEGMALMESIVAEVKLLPKPEGPVLLVLSSMELAQYSLKRSDVAATKAAIESCAGAVESFVGVDPSIAAAYYRVSAEYDKVTLNYASFYKNMLLYLTCVKIEEMELAEAQQRAHDLCLAALLGEKIYNFGELLCHPILAVLRATSVSYLHEALLAFNAGDHEAFDKLLPAISTHEALAPHIEMLRQKLCLMSLVEVVFCQLKSSRVLPFRTVSQATRVPLEEVEFLLMKALSFSLIRGFINEPEACFTIEWVQPRFLDLQQISELRAGIHAWRGRVKETCGLIHSMVPEQLAAISST